MIAERTAAGSDAALRRDLRAQIARLEKRLGCEPAGSHGSVAGGPVLLDAGELERVRDRLAAAVVRRGRDVAADAAREAAARRRLEALLADPRAHRGTAVALAELGVPGCGVYRPRPRLGLLGRLAGWWEVKLSSGCPLAPPGAER